MSTRQSVITAIQELRDLVDNGAALASKPNGACAEQAIETIAQYVQSTFTERIAQVEADIAHFRSEHAAIEILTPAEQEAKAYAKILEWHDGVCKGRQGVASALVVAFHGPFHRNCDGEFFYARLANGQAAKGQTRLDALAHLAQWCEQQLTDCNG